MPYKQEDTPELSTYLQKPAEKESSLTAKLFVLIVTLLIYVLPWVFTTFTEEYFETIKNYILLVGIILLSIIWLIRDLGIKNVSLVRTPIDKANLLTFLLLCLVTATSLNSNDSIWGYHFRLNGSLMGCLFFIALFYLIINNIRSRSDANLLLHSSCYSIALLALFTIFKALGVFDLLIRPLTAVHPELAFLHSPNFTPAGNPNSLPLLFIIGLLLAIFLFLNKKPGNLSPLKGTLGALLFIAACALTSPQDLQLTSLAIWAIIAGCITVGIFLIRKQPRSSTQGILWIYYSLLLTALCGFWFSADPALRQGMDNVLTGIGLKFNFAAYPEFSLSTGLAVIQGQISRFGWRALFLGSGPDTYPYIFSIFRPLEQNFATNWYENYTHSNSEFSSLLSNLGIVSTSLLTISFFVSLGNFLVRKVLKKIAVKNTGVLICCALVTLFFGYSFFLETFSAVPLFFFWLITAIGIKLYYLEFPDEKKLLVFSTNTSYSKRSLKLTNRAIPAIKLFVLGGALYTLIYVSLNLTSEILYKQGLELFAKQNYTAAYEKYTAAIALNNERDYYYRKRASASLMRLEQNPSVSQDQSQLISADIIKAISLSPENFENWEVAAKVYFKLSEKNSGKKFGFETLEANKEAINLRPHNPDNYLLLGYLYEHNADSALRNQAEQAYSYAYELQPTYTPSILALGNFLEQQGKKVEALTIYSRSREQLNEDPSLSTFLDQKIVMLKSYQPQGSISLPAITPTPERIGSF